MLTGSVRGRLARGAAWLTAARAAVNLVSFLSTLVLARLLTPADFGLVAIAMTILAIVGAVTELSLAQALIQHPDPTEDHYHTAWTMNAGRALLVTAIVAAAAWPLAYAYQDDRLVPIMLVLAGSVLLSGFVNPKVAVLARDLVFMQEFALSVGQKVAAFVVSVAIALVWHSYWALVLGAVAAQLVNIVLSYVLLPYRPRLRLRHGRDLWSFSVWLTLGQALNTINWRFDYLLIGAVSGRVPLGNYSVGDNLAALPTREATLPITKILFPALSRVAHDRERVQAAYSASQALLTSVALPIGFGFSLCAEPIVRLTMGDKWLEVVPIIQGLSAIFALQTLGSLVQPLAMAKGATRQLFVRDLISFGLRMPLIAAGLLLGGLPGVIAARMTTGLIAIAFNLYLVRQLIGLSIRKQCIASRRSLVSNAVMTLGVVALQLVLPDIGLVGELGASIAAGAVLYVGTHLLLWRLAGFCAGPEREIATLIAKAGIGKRLKWSAA